MFNKSYEMYQSGNAVSASDQLRYHGHLKYLVRSISQQTYYSTANGIGCSSCPGIFQTQYFLFSFNAVFATQCGVVLTWLWIVNPQNSWFFF